MPEPDILLYETYTPRQKMALARAKDSERTLTITLAAGKGVIIDAARTYTFDEAFNPITKAAPEQKVGVYVMTRNDGDTDYIWVTVKDKDTGAIIKTTNNIPADAEVFLDKGKEWGYQINWFLMPAKTWNLLVEAGHGR